MNTEKLNYFIGRESIKEKSKHERKKKPWNSLSCCMQPITDFRFITILMIFLIKQFLLPLWYSEKNVNL